jgi:superfamily I DNA/RNA helicase
VGEKRLDDFVMPAELLPREPGNASVAILAPYRGQVQLFRDVIRRRRLTQSVRAGTVHRLQGQEADIVVLDLSDAIGAELSLFFRDYLEEKEAERLLNVAVSRARHRLIVIMDLDFLDRAAPRWGVIHRFVAALREHATIIDAAELMPPTRAWSAVS